MNPIIDALDFPFFQRALWTAAMIGFANGFLSGFIVLRRSALFVGSMSHTLLPGIALAVLIVGLSAATAFIGGLVSALLVGLGAIFLSRTSRIDSGTALAVLYTGSFAVGLVLIDLMPIRVELEHWLFGNILALSNGDLIAAFLAGSLILITLVILMRPLLIVLFEPTIAQSEGIPVRTLLYILMGLVILGLVTSISAVGCILSVAMLVAPAAAMHQFVNSPVILIWGGAILGGILAPLAVVIAYWLDLRIGATIVLVLTATVLAAYLLSPQYGALRRWRGKPPHAHG